MVQAREPTLVQGSQCGTWARSDRLGERLEGGHQGYSQDYTWEREMANLAGGKVGCRKGGTNGWR